MKPITLLYLDDDELDRHAFLRMVHDKALPYEVVSAATLAEARARLAESKFDLLVADDHLPDGDCTDLFEEVLGTPLILLTGTLEEQLALQTLERGADDYLPKTPGGQHLEALPLTIEKTLHRKRIYEAIRKSEEAVRESELFHRTLVETSPVAVVLADPQGKVTYISPAAKEMFGLGPGEGLGTLPTDWIAPEYHEIVFQRMRKVLVELQAQPPVEYKMFRRDRTPIWASVASAPLLDARGRLKSVITVCQNVTERRLAQAAVQESEERLAAFMRNLPAAAWIKDAEGRYVYANPEAEQVFGKPLDDLRGKTDAEIFPPQTARQFRENDRRVLAEGGSLQTVEVLHQPDGADRHSIVSKFALPGFGGEPACTGGVAFDITERRQLENRLEHKLEELQATKAELARQNEQLVSSHAMLESERRRYQELFDFAPNGYLVTDLNGLILEANLAACKMLGQTGKFVARVPLVQFLAREDQRKALDLLVRFRRGARDQTGHVEMALQPRGSEPIPCLVTINAIMANDGSAEGLRWLLRDITERKQAEQKLSQSEQRLALATSGARIGIFDWDAVTGDRHWTPEHEAIFGYAPTTTTKHPYKDWADRVHPDDLPRVVEEAQRCLDESRVYEAEYRVLWPDGSVHWIEARGRPVCDSEGRATRMMGTVMDITGRKMAEDELKAARRSAEQAKAVAEQANRAKDHFFAVLSHELRTPLTPIVMAVSILERRPDLDPTIREMLEMVRRNIELESGLIDDLLDVSRIARGKIELTRSAVPLCSVIQRAVEVCKPDIEARRLHFGVDLGPAAPYWVNADVPRLQQVFWNLLKNAIKFTPHDGCVGIRCRPGAQCVVAEVNDSGIGIEPQALPRVFNAFEQVEQSITRQFGGLGLGLAICKALVELHGGTISAHSEGRDKGASFQVRLPLTSPVRQREIVAPAAPPSRTVRPLHILLVEDHGVTAKMMAMVLTAEGNTVETAGDMATAVELAEQHTFDLLLSDLGLPDGSGHDLLRQLRARGHKFPGIALTGYGQEQDIQRSHEAGFAAHLTKPASRDAVVEAIAAVTPGEPLTTLTPAPAASGQAFRRSTPRRS